METAPAVRHLVCTDCGATLDASHDTCPDCDGILSVRYDLDTVDLDRGEVTDSRFDGIARYADLLPLAPTDLVTVDEGATPLVSCPHLAEELGVASVYVKDEGRNPTGSVADRGLALAVSAAAAQGATDVALPTTGTAGQAAAAYAARAGLDSHSFVPSRAIFGTKAMINVHGGDMSVVGGRFDDAVDAFAGTIDDEGWQSVAAFETPYRREGLKTLAYELAEQLDWEAPDAVVYPTGEGVGPVGLQTGARELAELGLIEDAPAIYAAQAEGCAPIVDAFENGRDSTDPWDVPDTICGEIEIADPTGGTLVLDALEASGGGAVATPDDDILERAVTVAQQEGVEMSASSGAAASGAWALADDGTFEEDDTVVIVNTVAADKEADVLRSHLMSKGI